MFYRFDTKNFEHLESVDVIGFGHKSNGKAGDESRSENYIATQFNFKGKVKNYLLHGSLLLRYANDFDDQNSNLLDHQGPYELNLVFSQYNRGFVDKTELGFRYFAGGQWGQYIGQGGQQVSLSFRIQGLEISPSFLIQYYHGYNESLKTFDHEENVIRFGLML